MRNLLKRLLILAEAKLLGVSVAHIEQDIYHREQLRRYRVLFDRFAGDTTAILDDPEKFGLSAEWVEAHRTFIEEGWL